jgi:hypothetical protein
MGKVCWYVSDVGYVSNLFSTIVIGFKKAYFIKETH